MPHQYPVPTTLRAGPFQLATAAKAGVTRSQLRSRHYSRPFRGVHVAGKPADVMALCAAAALVLASDAAFSHHTAALLLGSDLGDRSGHLEVTVPAALAVVRRKGIRCHVREMPEEDVVVIGRLRVTSPARTFVDLAECASRSQLIGFGDAMLHNRRVSLEQIARLVEAHEGRRGIRRAREILRLLDSRAESPRESELRLLLLDAGLPAPEVNANIYDRFGHLIARADLLYRKAKVIVEFDGDQHRTDRVQFARDLRRCSELAANGYLVLRFTSSDLLHRPSYVLATVHQALSRATS